MCIRDRTPPAVEVHLEYPRQTNATTSYNDINNLDDKIYVYVGQAAADYEKRDRQLTKAALGGMGILGALFLLLGIAL